MASTTLTCRFSLPALHTLQNPELTEEENLAVFGPCSRLHGHEYWIEVTVTGPVDPVSGLVMSRDEMDELVAETLLRPLSKTNLNDAFEKTSGEALAVGFYERLEVSLKSPLRLRSVTVQETRKNRFTYLKACGWSRPQNSPSSIPADGTHNNP